MISSDVTAKLAFNQDLRGGTEPAGTTINLNVNANGFYPMGGLGGSGQSVDALSVEDVARMLTQSFDRDRLQAVLKHIAQLCDAI